MKTHSIKLKKSHAKSRSHYKCVVYDGEKEIDDLLIKYALDGSGSGGE